MLTLVTATGARLGGLLPDHAAKHQRNDGLTDAELRSQVDLTGSVFCVQAANGGRLLSGEFCPPISFACIYVQAASFDPHVRHVVGVGSEKKVFRVAAKSVVACVANACAIRDLAYRKGPRKPVS